MHKYEETNLPGIPRAPVLKFHNVVQISYEKSKETYKNKIPFLSSDDVLRLRRPYTYLLQQLVVEGYDEVVEEILELKSQEENEQHFCDSPRPSLISQTNLLSHITEVLKRCHFTKLQKNYMEEANARFQLAEELIDSHEFLARHFLDTALAASQNAKQDESCLEFEAKLHCLLAFLGKKNLEDNIEESIKHLEKARHLSHGRSWWFHSTVVKVNIEKPISICGLREDTETISCSTLTVYKVATILYCEILMMMIKETSFLHLLITQEDFGIAFHLSKEVLEMAREIRHLQIIASALTRYGILLRQSGNYNEALVIFHQLRHESELSQDLESLAIAYGNIAHCLQGTRNPLESLNFLYDQNEISKKEKLSKLVAEAIERMGYILLQEGQIKEAEECMFTSFLEFSEAATEKMGRDNSDTKFDSIDTSWAMTGVASGMGMWGRFASHCRQNEDNETILDWKDGRKFMKSVPRPSQDTHAVYDYFDHLDEHKIPIQDNCDLSCLRKIHSEFFKKFQRVVDMKNSQWNALKIKSDEGSHRSSRSDGKTHHLDHYHDKVSRVPRQSEAGHHGHGGGQRERAKESVGSSYGDGGVHHTHRHRQVSVMSDEPGSPKLSVISISPSQESLETISYSSDKLSHSHSSEMSQRHNKILAHTSPMKTNTLHLGPHPHPSRVNSVQVQRTASTTMSVMAFHNKKSVAMLQSHRNIINPDLLSHVEPKLVNLQIEMKQPSAHTARSNATADTAKSKRKDKNHLHFSASLGQ